MKTADCPCRQSTVYSLIRRCSLYRKQGGFWNVNCWVVGSCVGILGAEALRGNIFVIWWGGLGFLFVTFFSSVCYMVDNPQLLVAFFLFDMFDNVSLFCKISNTL